MKLFIVVAACLALAYGSQGEVISECAKDFKVCADKLLDGDSNGRLACGKAFLACKRDAIVDKVGNALEAAEKELACMTKCHDVVPLCLSKTVPALCFKNAFECQKACISVNELSECAKGYKVCADKLVDGDINGRLACGKAFLTCKRDAIADKVGKAKEVAKKELACMRKCHDVVPLCLSKTVPAVCFKNAFECQKMCLA